MSRRGFGAPVLPCFMSHPGVGRARTKLALHGLWYGDSSWQLSARHAPSLNAEAAEMTLMGARRSGTSGGSEFDLSGPSSLVGAVVFRGTAV